MKNLILLVVIVVFGIGFYNYIKPIYWDIPVLKNPENRFLINYDSVKVIALNAGRNKRTIVCGRDSINNKKSCLEFYTICYSFANHNCDSIRNQIETSGMTLLTAYNSSGKGVLFENTTIEEIVAYKQKYANSFFYFMAPGILWFCIYIARRLLKKYGILMLLIFCAFIGKTQDARGLILEPTGFYSVITTVSETDVYTYPVDYLIVKSEQAVSIDKIDFSEPEAVLFAMINARNNSWVDRYVEEGLSEKFYKQDSHYKMIESIQPTDFVIEPKFMFFSTEENKRIAFIRYLLKDQLNNRQMNALLKVQEFEDGFRMDGDPIPAGLGQALTYLKSDVLLSLFDPTKEDFKEIRARIYEGEFFNLVNLGALITEWYADPDKYAFEIKNYLEF